MGERKGVEILGGSKRQEPLEPEQETIRGPVEKKGVEILDRNTPGKPPVKRPQVRMRTDLVASTDDE